MNVWMLFSRDFTALFHGSYLFKLKKKNILPPGTLYVAILSLIIFYITQGSDDNNETNKHLSST